MFVDFNSHETLIDPKIAGNKFYNLYLLHKAGFNVPSAFCITDSEYDQQELKQRIDPAKKYAVRSSSNREDASGHSAAGVFKSYLNILGYDEIVKHIDACFQSAISPEARSYFKKQNIMHNEAHLAVIVQEMVDAQKAGVMFTVNPINGTDEIIIEETSGLAEKLVDGKVNPARHIYKKSAPGKDSIFGGLVKNGLKIEAYFNKPQDIEWACKNKTFYILQSRPVTLINEGKGDLAKSWTRANIGEIIPLPLTPLSWDIFTKVLFKSYRFGFYGLHDRLIMNIIHFIPKEYPKIKSPQLFNGIAYLNLDTVRIAFSFEPWVSEEILGIGLGFNFKKGELKKNLKMTTRLIRMLKKIEFFIERIFPSLSFEQRGKNYVEKELKKNYKNNDSLQNHLSRISFIFGWHLAATARSFSTLGYYLNSLPADDMDKRMDFLYGQKKTELVIGMNKIRQTVKKDESIREFLKANILTADLFGLNNSDFRNEFGDFLDRFGHRSSNEFELRQPSWKENPSQLKDALLSETDSESATESHKTTGKNRIIHSFRLREDLKNLLIREYRKLRQHFLDLAKTLVRKGLLESTDDIFYLNTDEIFAITEEQKKMHKQEEIISARKKEFERCINGEHPYSFYGQPENASNLNDCFVGKDYIRGVGCAFGRITGRAVHVFSLEDSSRLSDGDILITTSTDPGWTPLFSKAAGVVTEIGGMLSHTATIAREYGIPMISGIENLKSRIADGQRIEMNGGSGIIKIADKPEKPQIN